MAATTELLSKIFNRLDKINGRLDQLSADVTSLTRHVDHMDERLINVERHAVLIPGIAEAVGAQGISLDDHERRLKRLEEKPV